MSHPNPRVIYQEARCTKRKKITFKKLSIISSDCILCSITIESKKVFKHFSTHKAHPYTEGF